MNEFFSKNWGYFVIAIGCSIAISYGVSDLLPFEKALSVLFPISLGGCFFFIKSQEPDEETEEIIRSLDLIISEQSQAIEEKDNVLEEYEKIFDSQLVELPCVCGGNTFQGLFSPKTENVVQCEKCNNNYKVNIHYDSVLISEPMNLEKTFDELVGKPS